MLNRVINEMTKLTRIYVEVILKADWRSSVHYTISFLYDISLAAV